MKVFLDTSSLIKLYHREAGTQQLEFIFSSLKITAVFLTEIAKIEFASAIWKKVRIKEMTDAEALTTLHLFDSDSQKYIFISADSIIIERARLLIEKYNVEGLRTLDSIQLATCVSLSQQANLFLTSDYLLKDLLVKENLPTQ